MQKPKTGKGVIIGKNVQFGKDVVIWNYVVIGDNTKIGHGTRIGSFCDVGKDVLIGKNCVIQAHVTISNECKLGDNIFIGPNSSLLNDKFPHSRCLTSSIIKDNVIIGGCVTKDIPSKTVVKGIPAKPTMTRQEYETKRKEFIEARKT